MAMDKIFVDVDVQNDFCEPTGAAANRDEPWRAL